MFELVKSGGWVMWPLILCSIAAMAIIGEKFWSLHKKHVLPPQLIEKIQQWMQQGLEQSHILALCSTSPLGRILTAGLINQRQEREVIRDAIEDAGRHVVSELERYLNTLGTIAAISPFLGLLGTVLGMIQMFSGLGARGLGDPAIIASGIGQALITTAAGLTVAIPSLMFYRYFRGRTNDLLLDMEREAVKLLEILDARREQRSV